LKVDFERFLDLDAKMVVIRQNLDKKRAIKNVVSKEIPTLSNEKKNEKIKEMQVL